MFDLPYGGAGGFGLIDPSLMTTLGQNPQFGHVLDLAGVPAPQAQLNPAAGGQQSLGDILGGGDKSKAMMQLAQPKTQEPPKLVAQQAPQLGKMPGNPLMDMLLATMMSGRLPGGGR